MKSSPSLKYKMIEEIDGFNPRNQTNGVNDKPFIEFSDGQGLMEQFPEISIHHGSPSPCV